MANCVCGRTVSCDEPQRFRYCLRCRAAHRLVEAAQRERRRKAKVELEQHQRGVRAAYAISAKAVRDAS